MNQQCVDAVKGGDIFVGGGTGVRVRLSEYFDAIAGVDVLAGAVWNGTINIDFNVGVAFIDSVHPSPEWQKSLRAPRTNDRASINRQSAAAAL